MTSPVALMALVNQLERETDIHLRYMGIDCWPIVRNTFMTMVTHSQESRSRVLSIYTVFRSFVDFIYLLLGCGETHALVITDFKYKSELEGRCFLKDASVIQELLDKYGKKCHVVTQGIPNYGQASTKSQTVFLLTALSVLLSRILMRLDRSKKISRYLESIFLHQKFELLSIAGNQQKIKRNIYFVIVASFLFKMLLKRIKPQKCYIVCYYSCLGMAICAACRSLGIESIDVQHGVSGSSMRAYGRWSNLPAVGLNTLPRTFFCWTSIDVKAIESWADGTKYHRAILTGNIWRQYLKESKLSMLPEELSLAGDISTFRRVVLFSARSKEMPDQILSLLKNAPDDYFFMVRMHPNTPWKDLEVVKKVISHINASCSVIRATKARIHYVARLADVHITEWSASIYDARFEGVYSLIITPVGKEYFSDFIEEGTVGFCSSLEEIITGIENVNNKKNGLLDNTPISYIEKIMND